MQLPERLQQAIEQALAAMYADEARALRPGYRQAIYAALGPRLDVSAYHQAEKEARLQQQIHPDHLPSPLPPVQETAGHIRRTRLAIWSVEYVLPVVEQVAPQGLPDILRLLDEARRVLREPVNRQAIHHELNNMWDYYIQLGFQKHYTDVSMVGNAAVFAVRVALEDEQFDPEHIDYSMLDDLLEPFDHDVAWHAVTAYASRESQDEATNLAKRQEFWERWLTQGVPQAYESVPDDQETKEDKNR
jgi:hypothetical protein